MKKFLLSLAAVACAASMSATSYSLYSASSRGEWTQDGTSFVTEVNAGGKTFKITYAKGSYNNNLVSPSDNVSWRCYKGSEVTIESSDVTIKTFVVGFDNYEYQGSNYYGNLSIPEGWTGVLNEDDLTYTATSETGSNTVTFSPSEKQVRIVSLIVSDVADEIEPPVGPEDEVYSNAFAAKSDLDDWTQTYLLGSMPDELNAWYINASQKCLCASSYVNATKVNEKVHATLSREFDLTQRENCTLSLSQAFGYFFPTNQTEAAMCTLYVIDGDGIKQTLDFANYGTKGSGNWTSFADNEFDLSEFDGQKITLGFDYNNEDGINCTWELKSFVLKGDKTQTGAVSSIEAEENAAPVYYNLQGVRVANPENGLFIVVKGNKSQKVIF